MSKKILVIDDPKTCRFCPCCLDLATVCVAAHREFADSAQPLIIKSDSYKPAWCPLKDVPEHKMDWRAGENGYETGWNDCLDVIGVE